MEAVEDNPTVLEQFASGDLAAFEVLFRQFQPDVYRWIVSIVRDRGTAEDLTIETFWRIYRARGRFDTDRSFAAWARRIATNLALNHLKRSRPVPVLDRELAAEAPADPAVRGETRARIEHVFRRLPPKLQVTAILALLEERPYHEIAEALGVSEGTVKSRVFRAVKFLRRNLQQLGITP